MASVPRLSASFWSGRSHSCPRILTATVKIMFACVTAQATIRYLFGCLGGCLLEVQVDVIFFVRPQILHYLPFPQGIHSSTPALSLDHLTYIRYTISRRPFRRTSICPVQNRCRWMYFHYVHLLQKVVQLSLLDWLRFFCRTSTYTRRVLCLDLMYTRYRCTQMDICSRTTSTCTCSMLTCRSCRIGGCLPGQKYTPYTRQDYHTTYTCYNTVHLTIQAGADVGLFSKTSTYTCPRLTSYRKGANECLVDRTSICI